MASPVVIGIKPAVAQALRAASPGHQISWADVADAAGAGTLHFALADPRKSGSALAHPCSSPAVARRGRRSASKVDSMSPNGNTNVTIGLVWAWHALTTQAPLSEAAAHVAERKRIHELIHGPANHDRPQRPAPAPG